MASTGGHDPASSTFGSWHLPWLVALTLAASLVAAPATRAAVAESAKRGKGTKVELRIRTEAQSQLLQRGKLKVRLRSTGERGSGRRGPRGGEGRAEAAKRGPGRGKLRVRLSAKQGKAKRLVEPKRVALKRRGKKTKRLRLTDRGREVLGACGEQPVTVQGNYKHKRGKGKGKRRKATARAKRTLAADRRRCPPQQQPPIDVDSPERCDPIDVGNCLLPYPNDYYTVADNSTATGLRLNLHPESLPKSIGGVSIFDPEYNRNDGFSPNNTIITRIPGVETQAAFNANDLVPQTNIGAYEDPSQRVVLINADTGERHPIWAELDEIPANDNQRLLIIHPAVALDYGARYIVAIRGLTNAGGQPLEPNQIFKAYRDNVGTGVPILEQRRPHMEDLFETLGDAGIARGSLYLAWDFTVASRDNLTQRLLAMRDDAFAQLGDTNLGDRVVAGAAPDINDVEDYEYILCDSDGTPECEQEGVGYPDYEGTGPTEGNTYVGTSQSDYIFKRVTGTITVPCYMDPPGAANNSVDPSVPCAAGSRLHYEGGSDVPSQNGNETWEAPFTCVLPRTGEGDTEMATGKPGVTFGHGLLQNHRIVEQLGLFPASTDGVSCGTDWIGLSAIDPITGDVLPDGDLSFLANLLLDLSRFPALPDRSQQGYINVLYLARAMAHPDGLTDLPELDEGDGTALDASEELGYLGVSLGGIFGGATTAVAPDWQRAVLSVPGMGFTTLLTRSTQFNQFLPLVYGTYPNPLERQIGISVLQALWDRGEPSAYVHRMTDQPFPNTPAHEVMLHEAFGDHQVANVQTETLARTLGAVQKAPDLAPGRSLDDEPFWGIHQAPSALFNVPGGYAGPEPASLFTIDTGPIRVEDFDGDGDDEVVGTNPNPISNVAPVDQAGLDPANWNDGRDPHEPSATSPAAQALIIPFLLDQGVFDSCVDPAPAHPFSPPYDGVNGIPATPQPCSAPPIHTIGEGL